MDGYRRSPLHMAARYGRREAVHGLLNLGADPFAIHERLWARAGSVTTEELGSYSLIMGLLGSVLEERKQSQSLAGIVSAHSIGGEDEEGEDPGVILQRGAPRAGSTSTSPELMRLARPNLDDVLLASLSAIDTRGRRSSAPPGAHRPPQRGRHVESLLCQYRVHHVEKRLRSPSCRASRAKRARPTGRGWDGFRQSQGGHPRAYHDGQVDSTPRMINEQRFVANGAHLHWFFSKCIFKLYLAVQRRLTREEIKNDNSTVAICQQSLV